MRSMRAGALLALGLLMLGCGSDKGTASDTGIVAGTVYLAGSADSVTVSGAIVACAGVTDTTDSREAYRGAYRLENVPVGTHTLTATKTNYEVFTTTVKVTSSTIQNIFIAYKGPGGGGGIGE